MKLIEFTGIPGSGKTTALPMVKQALVNKGWSVYDSKDIRAKVYKKLNFPFRQIVSVMPFRLKRYISQKMIKNNNLFLLYKEKYIENNQKVFDYIKAINGERTITDHEKNFVIGWFFQTAMIYQMAVDILDENSYLILDEGFVHKIVNLFVSPETKSLDKKKIEQYLSLIPKVELLFYINADIDLCIKRANKIQRLQGKTKEEISNFYHMGNASIVHAKNYLSNEGVRIVEINNQNLSVNYLTDLI